MKETPLQNEGKRPPGEDFQGSGCEMAGLLETLTKPWTMHILWFLSREGPMRFGALRRSVEGISARLLTVRLRTLEAEGFVERIAVPGKVPEVTYKPTSRLADMNKVLQHLSELNAKWQRDGRPGQPPWPEADTLQRQDR